MLKLFKQMLSLLRSLPSKALIFSAVVWGACSVLYVLGSNSVATNNLETHIFDATALDANTLKAKPFYHDSLKGIEKSYQGKPFLLSVWSQECAPCMKELKAFGELKAEHPDFNLVLISTDAIEHTSQIVKLLSDFNLTGKADSWIYATDRTEQLRYSIDQNWYGEMPRSYFYDNQGNRQATSGLLSKKILDEWVSKNVY